MKALLLSVIVAVALPGFSASESIGGDGHGGDPLRAIFMDAKELATAKISALKWCSFAPTENQNTVSWILEHKHQLIEELQNSRHIWISDVQDTCAFTRTIPGSSIYLSFPACRRTIGESVERAAELLVHEVTHHLGITLESEADALARAVMNATDMDSCSIDSGSPFDPRSCESPIMSIEHALTYFETAETNTDTIARGRLYQRTRRCNSVTGCLDWVQSDTPTLRLRSENTELGLSLPIMLEITTARGPKIRAHIGNEKFTMSASYIGDENQDIGQPRNTERGDFPHDRYYQYVAKVGNGTVYPLFRGSIGRSCTRLVFEYKSTADQLGNYEEMGLVFLANY